MPKLTAGRSHIAELKKPRKVRARASLAWFGRANTTRGGMMIMLWRRASWDCNAKPPFKQMRSEIQSLERLRHRVAEFKKKYPRLSVPARPRQAPTDTVPQDIIARPPQNSHLTRYVLARVQRALDANDALFFEQIAEAMHAMPSDWPVDQERTTLLTIAFDYVAFLRADEEGFDPQHEISKAELFVPLTLREMLDLLHMRLPNQKRDYDEREIRRWCAELGIRLLKVKPGRRKGSRKQWGGK